MKTNLSQEIPLKNAKLRMNSTATSKLAKQDKVSTISIGLTKAKFRTLDMFRNVSQKTVKTLINLYKPDFKLFQYSSKDFLHSKPYISRY